MKFKERITKTDGRGQEVEVEKDDIQAKAIVHAVKWCKKERKNVEYLSPDLSFAEVLDSA